MMSIQGNYTPLSIRGLKIKTEASNKSKIPYLQIPVIEIKFNTVISSFCQYGDFFPKMNFEPQTKIVTSISVFIDLKEVCRVISITK